MAYERPVPAASAGKPYTLALRQSGTHGLQRYQKNRSLPSQGQKAFDYTLIIFYDHLAATTMLIESASAQHRFCLPVPGSGNTAPSDPCRKVHTCESEFPHCFLLRPVP